MVSPKTFGTAINCMDGRVQLPLIHWMKERYGVDYVDKVTEPGPNRIVATRTPAELFQSILNRVTISLEKHGSHRIVIAGHHDCAGNPAPYGEQFQQLKDSVNVLTDRFPGVEVVAVWIDQEGTVRPIET
ncbi:MAG: hypothetical protein JXQ27_05635 [Acidobacteria bacterium]|nr:hypothetical protein [Acidobacteriota bacterium]